MFNFIITVPKKMHVFLFCFVKLFFCCCGGGSCDNSRVESNVNFSHGVTATSDMLVLCKSAGKWQSN